MPQTGLRGARRSIGSRYICIAPEMTCEIIAVSPPSWLLGKMLMSSRPLLACRILSAAIFVRAMAGCSIGDEAPNLYVNSAAFAGQCRMLTALTPATPDMRHRRDIL